MRGTSSAGLSRRAFVKSFAIASAAVLGRAGFAAPSERIRMGIIGLGGRGGGYGLPGFLHAAGTQVLAVCDVRRERRDAAKAQVDARYGNADCTACRDLRELLARGDLDAVYIAIGDRWHAAAARLALDAGLDVYSEKPCSLSLEESRALRDAVRRHGRVFQAGTQRRSEEPFLFAAELARNGYLGRVHTTHADIPVRVGWRVRPIREDLPAVPEPPRDEFDWDLYLGPIAWRPYHPGYLNWMGRADFHGGPFTDWASHTYDLCMWPLGLDQTVATAYTPAGTDLGDGLVATFPNGVRMIATNGGWPHPCRAGYEGEEGRVTVGDDGLLEVHPRTLLSERKRLVAAYRARTGRPLNHIADFLACVRSRRDPVAHIDICHAVHSTTHLATIAWLLNRPLAWDAARHRFVNDPAADRLQYRAHREPWRV